MTKPTFTPGGHMDRWLKAEGNDEGRAIAQAVELQEELDAAKRLIWIMADMHGGTITISRQSIERFDPAGRLAMFSTESGGVTLEARRDHGNDAALPPLYNWDR